MSAIVRNPLQPVNRPNIDRNNYRGPPNENQPPRRVYGNIDCNSNSTNKTGSQTVVGLRSTNNDSASEAHSSSRTALTGSQTSQAAGGTSNQTNSVNFPCESLFSEHFLKI